MRRQQRLAEGKGEDLLAAEFEDARFSMLEEKNVKDLGKSQVTPAGANPATAIQASSNPQGHKSKSSLSNFGRLSGAVAGRRAKR